MLMLAATIFMTPTHSLHSAGRPGCRLRPRLYLSLLQQFPPRDFPAAIHCSYCHPGIVDILAYKYITPAPKGSHGRPLPVNFIDKRIVLHLPGAGSLYGHLLDSGGAAILPWYGEGLAVLQVKPLQQLFTHRQGELVEYILLDPGVERQVDILQQRL